MTSCQIIPPYLLQHIADAHPDTKTSQTSRGTLVIDQHIRQRRSGITGAFPSDLPPEGDVARWTIYSANSGADLPGTAVRAENDPATSDLAVDEAYDGTAASVDFFRTALSRESIDGAGAPVTVTVHYREGYANAFWDGQQLVFGDGDGKVFGRFTKPMDVLAHEFTHGVTQHTAALAYQGQSGALNESVSDVFGVLAKQFALGQSSDEANWLVGEGIFLPGVDGVALRSMKEPGTAYDDPVLGRDPQVGTMSDYVETTDDNGGVHLNSGIPNRAFYLAATALGGNAWDEAGPIWYHALTSGRVTSSTEFAGLAQATIDSAVALHGEGEQAEAVRAAWEGVEVVPFGVAAGAAAGVDAGTGASGEAESGGPGSGNTGVVLVRRTGGLAGLTVSARADPATSPRGDEITLLVQRIDFDAVAKGTPQPDRFVYVFAVQGREVTVYEQELTDDLRRLADLVLAEASGHYA